MSDMIIDKKKKKNKKDGQDVDNSKYIILRPTMEKTIQNYCKTILSLDEIRLSEGEVVNTADLIVDVLDESFENFVEDLPAELKEVADILFEELSAMIEEIEDSSILSEAGVMDIAARRKRAMVMRRYKTKITTARKRATRRRANLDQIGKRASRRARSTLRDRFTGNKKYSQMTPSEKLTVDKRMARIPQSILKRLSSKMVPKVKQIENDRLKTAMAKSGETKKTKKTIKTVKPETSNSNSDVKQVKSLTPKDVAKKVVGKKSIKEDITELQNNVDINSLFKEAYIINKDE